MCEIVSLGANSGCLTSDGGIYETQMVVGDYITDVEFDVNSQITNFTMSTTGKWESYTYDDDDTAFYNETGERPSRLKYQAQQNAFMKFTKITNEKLLFANSLVECCNIVLVHRLNSGVAKVQGIDRAANGDWLFSKQKPVGTPSSLSGTGAEVDRIEVPFQSVGRKLSYLTTLSKADLLLL